jgi:hypothetical protein
MPTGQKEAFSRALIDKTLEFSGWNLLDPHEVGFEIPASERPAFDSTLRGWF